MDIINIEVLPDGTIKSETGKVSMPNHGSAEQFLRLLTQLTGGEATRRARVNIGAGLRQALDEHASDGHTHETEGGHAH